MSRLLTVGLTLLGCCAGELAIGCPLAPHFIAAESVVGTSAVEVLAAPAIEVAAVQPLVPQGVLVAPSYFVAPSVTTSAVVMHPAAVAVRPLAVLRSRLAPARASSRVVIRTRVR